MRLKRTVWSVIRYIFLIIVCFLSVFPIYFMFISASNSSMDIVAGRLFPGMELSNNLKTLFNNSVFTVDFINSIKYAVMGTIISVIVCSIAGYAFEIYHNKVKDLVMSILLLSIMVPVAATLIPLYTAFGKLSLLSKGIGFVLPFLSTAFLILLFRQSTRAFPLELVEAARIDGLGEVAIFIKIYVPVMRSTFATGVIVSFMNIWNDYLWALVCLQKKDSQTLPLLLSSMLDAYVIDYGQMMLIASFTTLPLAIIFFALQKNFTQGITGAVKG